MKISGNYLMLLSAFQVTQPRGLIYNVKSINYLYAILWEKYVMYIIIIITLE